MQSLMLVRIVRQAFGLVDSESEYRYDTLKWVRIAEVEPGLHVSVDDDLGPAKLWIEQAGEIVFVAIVPNYADIRVELWVPGEWEDALLSRRFNPRPPYTLGEGGDDE